MARLRNGVHSWEDVIAQRYQSNKPSSLPRYMRVRHALAKESAPKEADVNGANAWSQTDCALLTKLAPEIRLLIWKFVLGGQRLHIIQRTHRRLGYIVCQDPCEVCRGGLHQPVKDSDQWLTQNLLSLPLTCKQIYKESIYLLYSSNVFEFSNTWTLTYLHPTIPIDQWNAIRSVDLKWAFPGHWLPSKDSVKSVYVSAGRQQWIDTCHALRRMKGLEEFTLHLTANWFSEPIEKIPVFLEPLRGLSLNHPPKSGARWKIHLPPQPYYYNEINRLTEMMQREGLDCDVLPAECPSRLAAVCLPQVNTASRKDG